MERVKFILDTNVFSELSKSEPNPRAPADGALAQIVLERIGPVGARDNCQSMPRFTSSNA